jgi:hypothetical protein
VSLELNTIQNAIATLESINDSDILASVCDDPKFKRFLQGVQVLKRVIEVQSESLRVAEMQEDDDYQIQIEALKLELETCTQSIDEKLSILAEISPWHEGFMAIRRFELFEMDDLLMKVKSEQGRQSIRQEGTCLLCCCSFSIKGLVGEKSVSIIPYNGSKYHNFCINFLLNKVHNQPGTTVSAKSLLML